MMRRIRSVAASGASVNPPERCCFNLSIRSTETDSIRSDGKRDGQFASFKTFADLIHQFVDIGVIRGGKRHQRQFFKACGADCGIGGLAQFPARFFRGRDG